MSTRPIVVVSLVGVRLDSAATSSRWDAWRPTVSLFQHEDLEPVTIHFLDAWDFADVYRALREFADAYPFDPEREDYLVHITTGTHVAQICLFLLTEAHYAPGRLLQTHPPRKPDG